MHRLNRRDFTSSALAAIVYGVSRPAVAQPAIEPILPANVLWSADHEKGNLLEWSQSAPGISAGGNFSDSPRNNENLEVVVTAENPHTGKYAVHTKVKAAVNRTIGIRLLRWRDTLGQVFPNE